MSETADQQPAATPQPIDPRHPAAPGGHSPFAYYLLHAGHLQGDLAWLTLLARDNSPALNGQEGVDAAASYLRQRGYAKEASLLENLYRDWATPSRSTPRPEPDPRPMHRLIGSLTNG
jgi:hypothetical protein